MALFHLNRSIELMKVVGFDLWFIQHSFDTRPMNESRPYGLNEVTKPLLGISYLSMYVL